MASLICLHDKAENSVQSLVCAQCGRKLSAVQVGGVFADSYRVLAALGEDHAGFRYRVDEIAGGIPRVLREIVPAKPASRARLLSFGQTARHLIDARPQSLVATVAHFTQGLLSQGPRYYVVAELPPRAPSLQEALEKKQKPTEQEACGLFLRLLAGLKELYSSNPPIYLGALDADKVLLSAENEPIFLESRYAIESALGAPASSSDERFRKDLYACARVIAAALAGELTPSSKRIAEVVAKVKPHAFAYTLDWVLVLDSGHSGPDSIAQVEQFWEMIESAFAAMKFRDAVKGVELFQRAHLVSKSARVKTALRVAEEVKADQGVKTPNELSLAPSLKGERQSVPSAPAPPAPQGTIGAKPAALAENFSARQAAKPVMSSPVKQAPGTESSGVVQNERLQSLLRTLPENYLTTAAGEGTAKHLDIAISEMLRQSSPPKDELRRCHARINSFAVALAQLLRNIPGPQLHQTLKPFLNQARQLQLEIDDLLLATTNAMRVHFEVEFYTSPANRERLIDAISTGLRKQIAKLERPADYFDAQFQSLAALAVPTTSDILDSTVDKTGRNDDVRRLLNGVLQTAGMEQIVPKCGEEFRAVEHQVLQTIKSPQGKDSGRVERLVNKGFRRGNEVVRKASVVRYD